jgi:hypothetical protein
MKTKTFFLIVCAIALFFSGCQKDEFFTEPADHAVLKKAVVKELPIKLIGSGYVTVNDFAYVEALGDYFPSVGISDGIMTHLGKLKAEKSIWYTTSVAPDLENKGFLIWSQEGDWCAANGDMLHWKLIDGSLDMINKKVSGRAIFDGGTGRFKNATGYFDLNGHVDPDNPTTGFIVDSGVGMISNVGNGK